jgi:hypothetical protein
MHLRIGAIYSAEWGGRFMQTNRCGKTKLIQILTVDSAECSTAQIEELKRN